MKVLILAVLAVVQAAPPVPRQAPDSSASTSKTIQHPTAKDQTSRQPTSPAEAKTTPNHDASANKQGEQNTEHSVTISKLPPVTVNGVKRDWADWGTWGFNLLLVFVGALQVVLLCWTFRLIRHQAREATRQRVWMARQWQTMQGQIAQMESAGKQTDELIKQATKQATETEAVAVAAKESADAALLNAKAMINAERPWVMIQIKEMPVERTAKTIFQLSVFNYGKNPAHIIDCRGPKIEFYDSPNDELPIPPDYGVGQGSKRFLAPKDSFPIWEPIDPSRFMLDTKIRPALEQATRGKVPAKQGSKFVLYGFIQYTDGISTYRTAFCYRLHRELPSDMGGHLVPCGPPIYNEYT